MIKELQEIEKILKLTDKEKASRDDVDLLVSNILQNEDDPYFASRKL